jgi:hypothetical protein
LRRVDLTVDLGVLVDIISNVAGMMILLACVAMLVSQRGAPGGDRRPAAKPINYPLAYLPDKRSDTFCLRHGKLYQLPEKELLTELTKQAASGKAVGWAELTKDGVKSRIEVVPTATGFRFYYSLLPEGGIPLNNKAKLIEVMNEAIKLNPPDKFFFVFHVWPEHFAEFRDLREYLLERGVEVGWSPRNTASNRDYDLVYAIGEYNENLSSIKAQ